MEPSTPPTDNAEAAAYWEDQTPPTAQETDESEVIATYTQPSPERTPASQGINVTLQLLSGHDDQDQPADEELVTPARQGMRRRLPFDTPAAAAAAEEDEVPRAPRRRIVLLYDEDESGPVIPQTPHLIAPRTPAPSGLFDIYVGTPWTVETKRGLPVPVVVVRQATNLLKRGRTFAMDCFNLRHDGHPTVLMRGTEPIVTETAPGSNHYCLHFTSSAVRRAEDPNAKHTPLGVVRLRRALFPSSYGTRQSGTELVQIDPVFLAVPSQHVTVVMSSAAYSTTPDHFVLQLLDTQNRALVTLAVAKLVLAVLLFRDQSEVRFNNIPVSATMHISLVLSVRRMKRSVRNDTFAHVAIEQARWYVPEGIDALAPPQ